MFVVCSVVEPISVLLFSGQCINRVMRFGVWGRVGGFERSMTSWSMREHCMYSGDFACF